MLAEFGIKAVFHYAPLHYLPFIARRQALLSKGELRRFGFSNNHFRGTSRNQDEQRGFLRYVHLTLDPHPPILKAKLNGGFPHFEVSIPHHAFEDRDYLLCRFNIAKTRYLRGAKQEPEESLENGRYYGDMRLPVAASIEERFALLQRNLGKRMIEVLVPDQMPLLEGTTFRFFHERDLLLAERALAQIIGASYALQIDAKLTYEPQASHSDAVAKNCAKAIDQPEWLGSGLDFDRM